MNKFKFGDKVLHDIEPVGFGVVISTENGESYVAFKSGTMDWFSDAELTPATDWVKCSERMPELGVPVLVIGGSTAWVDKAYDSDDGVSFYEDNYGRVTHWMPLPAQPAEDTQ